MSEWARVANTTIHEYVREVEENIMRNRKLLALMKSKGRITMNHAGDLRDWKVRYKRAPMRVFRESETLTFARVNRWKTAQLDWRGYAATDSITKLEQLKNKNVEAIVKVYSQMAENLTDDITENFHDELYIDGNLAANAGKIHGLESWFSVSGPATQGYVGINNDTYAGLSTALAAYGGTWGQSAGATTWPRGSGDPEYDFWTPMVVDYTDTLFKTPPGAVTWPESCTQALRFGINHMMKNKSAKGMINMIILERELYRQFEEKLAVNERLMVTRGDSKDGLYALGFRDTINFDGVDITPEYGIPANVGYGMAIMHMELCSLQDRLFVPLTPDFDIASYSERFSIDFFGNLNANPRYQLKFQQIT